MDTAYRADLRELNDVSFARFDAKLEQRLAQFDAKLGQRLAEVKAELRQAVAELRTELRTGLAHFLPLKHGAQAPSPPYSGP
jgi:CRP-like cAMP-binding protein